MLFLPFFKAENQIQDVSKADGERLVSVLK